MRQLLPADMVLETGIQLYENVFPLDLLCEMAYAAVSQPERKVTYDTSVDGPFPDPFDRAARLLVGEEVAPAINTLIVKRYNDDDPSAAFTLHRDPEEFEDQLVLCSLGSRALLEVINLNLAGPLLVSCSANTVVTLPAYRVQDLHRVTPPDPASGIRPFAFFGHRHT